MSLNLFTYLPSEIIFDILSRLPVHAVISCKCVCKSWRCLLETHEFVKSHLSKAVPSLAFYGSSANLYAFSEFVDGFHIEHHDYKRAAMFDLPYSGWISGSANGLLLLYNGSTEHSLYICNPVTRDYIKLHCPLVSVLSNLEVVSFGFGVSNISGQYKVVQIFEEEIIDPNRVPMLRIHKPEPVCHVYTIGTLSWRRITPIVPLLYEDHSNGVFLNGSLHWLVDDLNGSQWISCLDLETELFSILSPFQGSKNFLFGVFALGEYLCLCDNSSEHIVIWLMKEYGVEKSWNKEYVIPKSHDSDPYNDLYWYEIIYPIKIFKNGDILMVMENELLLYYSKEKNTTRKIDMFESHTDVNVMLHTPSFVSLQGFEMENVTSY